VIDGVYGGHGEQPAWPLAPLIRGFHPGTFQYPTDLAKAKALLVQAGVEEGAELKLTMESGVQLARSAAQLLQANLAEIGITLTIELVDLTTFTALYYGDMPAQERPNLMWWGWWPDYNDAWNHLYPQISCDAWGSKGANAGFYCNEEAEALLAQAKDAPDEATYLSALAKVQEIVALDPPAIYYIQPLWLTVIRKDLAGFVFNPVNIGTYNFYRMSRVAS
jgi:peptide/nickel transport system substrate-binding protein